jgi:hypothetical protein
VYVGAWRGKVTRLVGRISRGQIGDHDIERRHNNKSMAIGVLGSLSSAH